MPDQQNHRRWTDVLITAISPVIWGTTYIVTTELLPPDRPFIAALLRTLPAGLLLTMLFRRLPKRHEWSRLIILSALNIGFFQALLFVAATRLPGGLAAVVGAIQPLLVMGLAWAIDRHQPARLAVGASVLGIAGMAALLLSPGAAWDGVGITAALAGAVCMASGTFLSRRWKPDVPVMVFTGWQLMLGGALLIPAAWYLDAPLTTLSTKNVLGYGYLAIFGTALAYALWFRGIARLWPVAVSSLGMLSPLTAVVLGWLLLGQSMSGQSLLGLLIVFGSILTVQLSQRPPAVMPATRAASAT